MIERAIASAPAARCAAAGAPTPPGRRPACMARAILPPARQAGAGLPLIAPER